RWPPRAGYRPPPPSRLHARRPSRPPCRCPTPGPTNRRRRRGRPSRPPVHGRAGQSAASCPGSALLPRMMAPASARQLAQGLLVVADCRRFLYGAYVLPIALVVDPREALVLLELSCEPRAGERIAREGFGNLRLQLRREVVGDAEG